MTLTAGLDTTGWYTQNFKPYWRSDFSASAAAYTTIKEMDFETGTPGASANGSDSVNNPATLSVYSTAQASRSSSQSMLIRCPIGGEAFGIWGGSYTFDAGDRPQHGDTVWFRFDTFVPTGANLDANPGFLKFIRLKAVDSVGATEGYMDVVEKVDGTWKVGNEMSDPVTAVDADQAYTRTLGAWLSMEVEVKWHTTDGLIRLWHEDNLIYEELGIETVNTATSYCSEVIMGTNWNGGAPLYLTGVTGTFSVGDTLSSDNAGGGTAGASFGKIAAIRDTNVFELTDTLDAYTTSGFGLEAGDGIDNGGGGATGTCDRGWEDSYFDNMIITTERPIQFDDSGNPVIGAAKVAVS